MVPFQGYWNPFCHFWRAGYKYPFRQACCRPWPLKPQAIMRLDTSGCHLGTKWMDFSVFQAPSPPSPFGAQESPGIHLDAHLINALLPLLISKNQTYEIKVGSFKCSFEEVKLGDWFGGAAVNLRFTTKTVWRTNTGITEKSTGGAVFWNNWLQLTEGLLALGSSY